MCSVSYGCDPDNVSKARALIVKDLEEMQSTPVDPQRLQQAKAILLRQIPRSESSIGSIARGWIPRTEMGLPLDEPVVAGGRYLKLTARDIQRAFARYLRPDDLVQVGQGPAPQ